MDEKPNRIKLTLDEPGGVDRKAWPVARGVPFAEGALVRGAPVRVVTADGAPVPAQAQCLATWREDLKYVKWLLVDFQIDLPAGKTREEFLEYGPGVRSVEPEEPVKIERTEERIAVDTGPLRMEFPNAPLRKSGDFVSSCLLRTAQGRMEIFRGRSGPHLYMSDQRGTFYDSSVAAPPPRIAVGQSGPLRATIRVEGYHASENGRRSCPYVLRLHFYAGKNDLRVFHTFVFDQNPDRIELARIGMHFPVDLGAVVTTAFGGTDAPHVFSGTRAGRLVHLSDVERRVETDGEVAGSGGKTRGWACANGCRSSVVAVLRDMWREYPKAIAFDAGGLDVQIWPDGCAGALKFSTPYKEDAVRFDGTRDEAEFKRRVDEKPRAPLNLKSLAAYTREDLLWVERMVAEHAPDRIASYNDTGVCDGFGAAKTTEFLLRFSAGPIAPESAEALGVCVQEPVVPLVDVDYACMSGATRFVAPFDPERFPVAEKILDEIFEKVVVEPRRVLHTYGMMDYGDLMCSHSASPGAMWTHFKDAPDVAEKMKHCARSYNNESNDQLNALWGNYIHRGERKYFLAAETYGAHLADVDMIHAGPHKGLVYYHNAHHWTGGPSSSHTCLAGLMTQYYLTGDRRIFDVCREAADWVLAHQEPCGIFSNREGVLVREYTTPVANLLEFYQATWEHRYGALGRRSPKWLLSALPEPGCFPRSIYTSGARGDAAEVEQSGWHLRQPGGMTPQMLYDAVQLFGKDDATFAEHLLGMADRYVWGPESDTFAPLPVGSKDVVRLDPVFNAPLIAYAYGLTGDAVYAAYCRYYLREHFPNKGRCHVVSPGARLCRRGLAETGETADAVREALPRRCELTVAVGGCPNNCVGSAVADIGLIGRIKKINGRSCVCYRLLVGGGKGCTPALAQELHPAVPEERVAEVVARLASEWAAASGDGALAFSDFIAGGKGKLSRELAEGFLRIGEKGGQT